MEQTVLSFAKRFAQEGYYVFPFYGSSKGPQKPFGWARNKAGDEVPQEKIIPATTDLDIIEDWPRRVADAYNGAEIVGYGVMGIGCVIFDLDNKNGKNGTAEFRKLQERFGIPAPEFVVKSKSGGYHLYYGKPEALKSLSVKSVANLAIGGTKYDGVDVRGDGGMVVGPHYEGEQDTWESGRYQIIKGDPSTLLSELPSALLSAISKASHSIDAPELTVLKNDMDELEILKRGEVPPMLSNGNRNNGFYLYLNALRNKGFSAETARRYVQELVKVTENAETLSESVDIEDMIARIWRVDLNNPYDVTRDLIESGLYRLTAYRSKLMYVNLNDNAYLDSKSPHDLPSMKQLLARYSRKMADQQGKLKTVNPADMIDGLITPDREVATLGFKPGASEVFTLTEAEGGRRYLNVWDDPRRHIRSNVVGSEMWDKFCFLVGRIFGPEGSDEYQLGLDFPAWILQNPGIKPVIAPFIMSRNRGAGKSLYLTLLTHIFGYSKVGELQARQYKVEEIETRFFNPSGSGILIFDEVQFPVHRNMRQESANFWKHLKSLVTSDTIPVEFKGGDVGVQMPNFAGIIMAGNTGNNFPIEEFDRRIWLIDNDPPELQEGLVDEFFAMAKNFMGREEKRQIIQELLTHLNNHKIKLPLDRMRAPMNEIKREMYLATLSDIEEWWITYFEERENLLAATPILSKSAILYLISIAERLMNSRWREDPENTFRELKRRGLVQPIRTRGNNYQTRNMRNVPIVKHDGSIAQEGEGRDVLYTTRQHGEFNNESNESVLQMFLNNLHGIQRWKKEALASRGTKIAGQLL